MIYTKFCHENLDDAGWWVLNALQPDDIYIINGISLLGHVASATNELAAQHIIG